MRPTIFLQSHRPPHKFGHLHSPTTTHAFRLVAEFLECSPASLVADAVESLCGEPLLHMVHTKEGARAACMALAYATAKERKKAVRAFKVGHLLTVLTGTGSGGRSGDVYGSCSAAGKTVRRRGSRLLVVWLPRSRR